MRFNLEGLKVKKSSHCHISRSAFDLLTPALGTGKRTEPRSMQLPELHGMSLFLTGSLRLAHVCGTGIQKKVFSLNNQA